MNIWTLNLIPCTYSGLLCFVKRTSGPKRFKLAKHGPVNFDGEYLEPLGAESRVLHMTFAFVGQYFEAHKLFIGLLDRTQLPLVPGVLTHPVWGEFPVYCEEYTPTVDFDRKEAVVEVTFRRHTLTPEIVVPTGFFAPPVPDVDVASISLAGYLASLAFMLVFNAAWLAAVASLVRLIVTEPQVIGGAVVSVAEFLVSRVESFFNRDFSFDSPLHDQVESRANEADAVESAFRREMRVSEAQYQSMADTGLGYDPGAFADGRVMVGRATPPARTHAAFLICAMWRTIGALSMGQRLGSAMADADRRGDLDPASADAAVIAMRRRLAAAARLVGATMPYHGASTVGELSRLGDGLARFLGGLRLRRPPTRTIVLDSDNRPLALIALDALGDATRRGEIASLNPHIRTDFNRLARGTELKVPA